MMMKEGKLRRGGRKSCRLALLDLMLPLRSSVNAVRVVICQQQFSGSEMGYALVAFLRLFLWYSRHYMRRNRRVVRSHLLEKRTRTSDMVIETQNRCAFPQFIHYRLC